MRYYTNSQGEKVEVTTYHLETAVELKLELQELSPSRKCNWNLHMKMMHEEGFNDSDVNESYRCMIKSYQKEIGKLSTLTKHADLIATSKLESIKNAVGEMYYQKNSESTSVEKNQ